MLRPGNGISTGGAPGASAFIHRPAPGYHRRVKIRNLVLSGVIVVVLALGGGAWWFFKSLDSLVKRAIEKWGPEITGVTVRVDHVKIEVAQGRGSIRGLLIGNPKGFEAPYALKVGEIRVALDPASLTKDVVVVKELLLVSPDVIYERGQGSDNLSVIQRNVDAWVAKHAGPKGAGSGPGKKFILEHVIVRDGRAHFGTTASAPIPDLHLRDVGKRTNGATAGEVFRQVWGALLRSVGNVASHLGSTIKEGARSATEGVRKLFK